jgi:hypothetical protein
MTVIALDFPEEIFSALRRSPTPASLRSTTHPNQP